MQVQSAGWLEVFRRRRSGRAGFGESAALQARGIQPRVRMARTIVRPIAKVNNFLYSLVIEIALGLVSAILLAGCALIGKLEK